MCLNVSDGDRDCIMMVASRRDKFNGETVGFSNVMLYVGGKFIIQDVLFGCNTGL
jgi:hypothetical protein